LFKQCKVFALLPKYLGIFFLVLYFQTGTAFPLAADPFHRQVADGDLDGVRRALARNPILATMNDELGRSPLHLAVINGQHAMVNVLINAGAEVNAVDGLKKFTPLHYAAFYSYPKILEFLLTRRADILAQDIDGNLPLHFAAANGSPATVRILLENNSGPDCLNNNWQTPLHLAAAAVENQKSFPAASKDEKDYLEVAKLLLQAGATLGIHDIWRNLPETIAWRKDHRSTFPRRFEELMRQKGRTR